MIILKKVLLLTLELGSIQAFAQTKKQYTTSKPNIILFSQMIWVMEMLVVLAARILKRQTKAAWKVLMLIAVFIGES